jgi:hypothetical protein
MMASNLWCRLILLLPIMMIDDVCLDASNERVFF